MKRRRMLINYKRKLQENEVVESPFKIETVEEVEDIKTPPSFIEEEEVVVEPIVEVEEVDERVICINTNKIYDNIKVASEEVGINANLIRKCCEGTFKSGGKDEEGNKLVWKFVKDL